MESIQTFIGRLPEVELHCLFVTMDSDDLPILAEISAIVSGLPGKEPPAAVAI